MNASALGADYVVVVDAAVSDLKANVTIPKVAPLDELFFFKRVDGAVHGDQIAGVKLLHAGKYFFQGKRPVIAK